MVLKAPLVIPDPCPHRGSFFVPKEGPIGHTSCNACASYIAVLRLFVILWMIAEYHSGPVKTIDPGADSSFRTIAPHRCAGAQRLVKELLIENIEKPLRLTGQGTHTPIA